MGPISCVRPNQGPGCTPVQQPIDKNGNENRDQAEVQRKADAFGERPIAFQRAGNEMRDEVAERFRQCLPAGDGAGEPPFADRAFTVDVIAVDKGRERQPDDGIERVEEEADELRGEWR